MHRALPATRPTARILPLLTLLTLAGALPAPAQGSGLHARVDRLFAEYDRPGSPGCALGVAQDGRLVYERGYGLANLDYDVPLGPSSVFYTASVSKQFAAATMALLADQGRISLDDDVRKYVPELPDYGAPITIRHLVHHTSGLRDYLGLMNLAGMRVEDVHTDQAVLDLVVRQGALNFPTGSEYLYSNTGYFLMSVIVERVTGQTLRQYADEFIFRPLGMRNTHFHDDRTMIVRNRAMAYSPDGNGGFRQNYWANFEKVGSGGLLSTVEDLFLWDQNFHADRLGSPRFMQEMHSRGVLTSGDTLEYAFGMNLSDYRGLRTVSHGGSSMGFRAHLLRFPDQAFAVITMCNVGTANPALLSQQVADLYLEGRFAAGSEPARAQAPTREEVRYVSLGVGELAGYAGVYHNAELPADYSLEMRGADLVLRRPAAEDTPLRPTGPDVFRAGVYEVRFRRDAQGRPAGFELNAGRVRSIHFERR
jgi:CubicO group peptidase (beta-lactamase class C family)